MLLRLSRAAAQQVVSSDESSLLGRWLESTDDCLACVLQAAATLSLKPRLPPPS